MNYSFLRKFFRNTLLVILLVSQQISSLPYEHEEAVKNLVNDFIESIRKKDLVAFQAFYLNQFLHMATDRAFASHSLEIESLYNLGFNSEYKIEAYCAEEGDNSPCQETALVSLLDREKRDFNGGIIACYAQGEWKIAYAEFNQRPF